MALMYMLFVLLSALIDHVYGNIATTVSGKDCSKVILTMAEPKSLFQFWHRDISPEMRNLNNKEIKRSCLPRQDLYVGIDYHYLTKTYFIVNTGLKLIEAYDDVSPNIRRRQLFKGVSKKAQGVAVDWLRDKVYWTDPAYDAIFMTSSDGTCQKFSCVTVTVGSDLDNPTGLAIHPYKKLLFWTNGNRLESSKLDGSDRKVLVDTLQQGQGIAVDFHNSRLYWIDLRNSSSVILTCDFHGNNVRTILERDGSSLYDIDIYQDYIIVTDRKMNMIAVHNLVTPQTEQRHWTGEALGVVVDSKRFNRPNDVYLPEAKPLYSDKNRGFVLMSAGNKIYRMERNFADTDDDRMQPFLTLQDESTSIHTITSDSHTGYVYFYEFKENVIQRVKLNVGDVGTEDDNTRMVLTNAVHQATDLAIDWITKNLYWTDKLIGQILVSRDDGNYPIVVLDGLKGPRTLTIDPINRYIFWGEKENVSRSQLDGSFPVYSIYMVVKGVPRLAVDPSTKRIYFNNGKLLCYGDYDGRMKAACQDLGGPVVYIYSMDILNDYVIFSESMGGLFARDKGDFSNVGKSNSKKILNDIAFHHVSRQHMTQNKCTERYNGGCEQVCLPNLSDKGYRCACTVGYWVSSDGSCRKGQLMEPYLLFPDLRMGKIYQSSLLVTLYGLFSLQILDMPLDVEFDYVNKKVYWSDGDQNTINTAYINGSHQHIVYANRGVRPKNIALDVTSDLIYFVDTEGSVTAVSVLTGAHDTLVLDHFWAYDVALDPSNGLMFITGKMTENFNGTSIIEHCVCVANMDGNSFQQLKCGLGKPSSIIVYKDRVIWADAKFRTIEQMELWSWKHQVLARDLYEPRDLVAHMDTLYWTEAGVRCILSLSLKHTDRVGVCMSEPRFFNLAGLAVASEEIKHSSVCATYTCPSSLCIPTPRGPVCILPREKFVPHECRTGRRACQTRETYMENTYCRVPNIANGTVLNMTPGTYVPVNFRIRVACNHGFKCIRDTSAYRAERYQVLDHKENICESRGDWAEQYSCRWDMGYVVQGTMSRGIVKFYNSSRFLVPPGVRSLDVSCLGGGGGGYGYGKKGGDGGQSSFNRHKRHSHRLHTTGSLRAGGGSGGAQISGGKGGFGYRYWGGNGGDNSSCRFGGATGQVRNTQLLPPCSLGVTYCPFCGAGGYGNPWDCTSPKCDIFAGACSGPWAKTSIGWKGSHYGGGAGSLTGGSGGAGGYSRKRWMRATPGDIVHVEVGKGGNPSFASAGDGIVVVAWGDRIENFMDWDSEWKRRGECLFKDPNFSCIQTDSTSTPTCL